MSFQETSIFCSAILAVAAHDRATPGSSSGKEHWSATRRISFMSYVDEVEQLVHVRRPATVADSSRTPCRFAS